MQYVVIKNEKIQADYYISSIPINNLAKYIDQKEKVQSWSQLEYRSIAILFIKINRPKLLEGLWTWFPEDKYLFYRISEYKNAIPELAPPDKTMISLEIGFKKGDAIDGLSAQELYNKAKHDLRDLYQLREREVLGFDLKISSAAYPILKKETEELQRNLSFETPFSNLFVAGRTGMFQYRMTEGSYDSGVACAKKIQDHIQGEKISKHEGLQRDEYGRPIVIHE